MRATHFFRPVVAGALLLSAAIPSGVHATLVAVYSRPGERLPPSPDSLVQAFKLNPAAVPESRFTFKISDSSVLSPEFSVPSGVSAYFWSDRTFELRGFAMQGVQATFLNVLPLLAAQALAAAEDTLPNAIEPSAVTRNTSGNPLRNDFQGVTLESNGLRLAYTLAQPGRVSLEAFGLDGRTLRRWTWEEAASGALRHSVAWPGRPRGAYWIRWSCGDLQVIRRISGMEGLRR